MINQKRIESVGYIIGFLLFVVGIPAIMWLVSGRSSLSPEMSVLWLSEIILGLVGLSLAVWTVVYMKIVGDVNPMDPFDHKVAPRTKHLMTSGPYSICRNPMLLGTYVYHIGILLILMSWQSLLVWIAFVVVMTFQALSEEKRLARDFPDEYEEYRKAVGRFTPRPLNKNYGKTDSQRT